MPQRARGREVEHEADGLEDLLLVRVVAIGVLDGPRRLHAERGLKVGLGRLEVAQHQDGGPLRHRDAGGELAARERDGLGVEAAPDGLAHGRQRIQPDARRRTGGDDRLVVVPEGVVLLGQQVRHRVAGRDVGQEPERVLQVGQQADIRIRKRRPRAGLEMLDLGRVPAADDVQPLLHVALVLELRLAPVPDASKERVEIELVELPGARDRQQFVRHLVGEQAHLRQRAVGVPFAGVLGRELLLGALLVGVGPVEDLLLDELARGQRLERRAGEVEVGLGRDGQELGLLLREHAEVLVHLLQAGGVFELGLLLGDRLFLALEQFLGGVAPRAEVVFVEDDEVPVHRVQPFVLGLDVARRIAAEQVLKGAEIDDRLLVDLRRIAAGVAREVLPAVEVHVGFEVRLPRILDGGLEGHHEHALGAELLRRAGRW